MSAKPRKSKRLLTTVELAQLRGQGVSTINLWVSQGCPVKRTRRGVANLFDPAEVREWLENQGRNGHVGRPSKLEQAGPDPADGEAVPAAESPKPDTGTRGQLAAAQVRKEQALARKHELQTQLLERKLIERDLVTAALLAKVSVLVKRLRKTGETLAPRAGSLSATEFRAIYNSQIDGICRDFAKGIDGVELSRSDITSAIGLLGFRLDEFGAGGVGAAGDADAVDVGEKASNPRRHRKPRGARTVGRNKGAVPEGPG